jgi:uncharacterized protein involved in exopolysaccharide biosynthesis
VVDRAEPADNKSWPPRALFIGLAAALSFLIACWAAGRRARAEYDRL